MPPINKHTIVVVLFLAACGAGTQPDDAGWSTVVDTVGGVVHVVHTPHSAGPVVTRVAEEEWRIGTVDGVGPTSFGMIRSVAVLADGRFAVGDAQAEEVRLFTADGRHLRTFGGEGAGPGELRGMQGVHVDHEGLLRVAEAVNARLSVFDPESGFVTSYPLQIYTIRFRGPWGAAVDSAGRTFVESAGQYGEGRYWYMTRVYDERMNQLDSIPFEEYTTAILHQDQPGAWRIDLGGGFTWAPVPYYSNPHRVVTPTGEYWSSAPATSHLEVARWTPAGDTSLVLTSRRRPDPVTAAERDSAMRAVRANVAERVANPPNLNASRVPATKPPLHGLSLDDHGRLWVRLTEPMADSTVYDVFERDGALAATVRMPFRVDRYVPPVVRGDTTWAVVTDELDVQHIVRARLRAGGGGE